jgi:leucyl-tRNA synthetase
MILVNSRLTLVSTTEPIIIGRMEDPRKFRYDHQKIEAKWQKVWAQTSLDVADVLSANKPFYNLMMFPYPSAEGLHMGNMYAITGSDIYGRFKQMEGFDVFEPIGLDGFGIHSENFALKIGLHPMDHAKRTEEHFYAQLHQIGAMFDFSRTLETYDPEYYRWTQWLFIQMFRHGLAYRAKAMVNFCPSCKTVLADEQVLPAGRQDLTGACERCGNAVEKRALEQWFFRITAYAEKLLGNIPKLKWSEKVKVAQTNWIGKKAGISITYPVVTEDGQKVGEVSCFTTRPETNFGATFVVLAPEHEFVAKILSFIKTSFAVDFSPSDVLVPQIGASLPTDSRPHKHQSAVISGKGRHTAGLRSLDGEPQIRDTRLLADDIQRYVASAKQRSEAERAGEGRKKTGVFTGLYCLNQLNKYKMPLFISDFILSGFGTGAVVGVPGHDKRDFQFAKTFDTFDSKGRSVSTTSGVERVELPVKRVVVGKDGDASPIMHEEQVQEEEGTMVNSGFLDGLTIHVAKEKIMEYLAKKGWGKRMVTYHLRDWLISRQRYWGPPIPMIYCKHCAKEGKSWFTTEEATIIKARSMKHEIRNKSKIQNSNDQNNFEFPTNMSGWYPVPEDQLPLLLPRIKDYKPSSDGIAPLSKHKEFFDTICPCCRNPAVRETDVSDTFLDSSWYYLRYPSIGMENSKHKARNPKQIINSKQKCFKHSNLEFNNCFEFRDSNLDLPWNREVTRRWLPVHMYTGGAEHSVLHLLYSRYITMVLHDLGYVDFDEPFTNFFAHGLIIKEGAKMSKSKGNVVNPDVYIAKYGADAVRLYLMFIGPFSQGGDFRDTGMEGMARWVGRVWRIILRSLEELEAEKRQGVARVGGPPSSARSPAVCNDIVDKKDTESHVVRRAAEYTVGISGTRTSDGGKSVTGPREDIVKTPDSIKRLFEKTIAKLTDDTEKRRYNTAIASLMELTNVIMDEGGAVGAEELKKFILLLAPFAPYVSEEAWNRFNGRERYMDPNDSVHRQPWPSYDPQILEEEDVPIIVQVDGKVRDMISVSSAESKNQEIIEGKAKASAKVQPYLVKGVKKVIFVPGKLINFVA